MIFSTPFRYFNVVKIISHKSPKRIDKKGLKIIKELQKNTFEFIQVRSALKKLFFNVTSIDMNTILVVSLNSFQLI